MAQNGKLITVTDSDFAEKVENSKGLTIVDFWAAWCGPCRIIAPVLEQLAEEYEGKVTIAKLDVDTNVQTSARFGVRSIPTLIFFKDGEVVETVVGAVPKQQIERRIQAHLA